MREAPTGYTPIRMVGKGCFVQDIRNALEQHPELWDTHRERTAPADSPHHGLSDVWVRFADPETMRPDGSHDSIWYPPADLLPGIKPLCLDLMRAVGGTQLGGVLITKIPAGKECKPHEDPGWHARHYQKFAVQIDAAPGQAFQFAGHSLETEPGDVYWFDNHYTHWVTNPTPCDRITLIVCIRTEGN